MEEVGGEGYRGSEIIVVLFANMENTFTVKNFRIFGENGASFKFKPITLLTGTNGSGKSSLTKAITLLQSVTDKIHKRDDNHLYQDIHPSKGVLDLIGAQLTLGDYASVLHNKNSDSKVVTFSTTTNSSLAPGVVFEVKYHFYPSEETNGNGKLRCIEVCCDDNQFFTIDIEHFASSVSHLNLNPILDSFKKFYLSFVLNMIEEQIENLEFDKATSKEQLSNLEDYKKGFIERVTDLGWISGEDDAVINSIDNRLLLNQLCQEPTPLKRTSILDCFCRLEEDDTLFYFPILEKLKGKSKAETCELLRNAELYFDEMKFINKDSFRLYHANEKFPSKNQVIESFIASEFDSFVDYYVEKERQFRKDIAGNRQRYFIMSKAAYPFDDFIHWFRSGKTISFCPSPNVGDRVFMGERTSDSVDFIGLYVFMSNWSWNLKKIGEIDDDTYINRIDDHGNEGSSSHYLFDACIEYLCLVIQDLIIPKSMGYINYLGNFHINLRRVYSLDQDDLFVKRIDDYLQAINRFNNIQVRNWRDIKNINIDTTFTPGAFIDGWLKKLGIGYALNLKVGDDGRAVGLFIRHSEEDEVGTFVSDEGYGVFQLIAILMSIETQILNYYPYYLLSDTFQKPIETSTLIIEEPEANMHPSYQTRLAEIFYSATQLFPNKGIQFIIETHSEYLIRATQAIVAKTVNNEKELEDIPFVVHYIDKGGVAYDMEYQVSGRFNKPFGTGFFDEAGKSSLEIIKKERRMADGKDA